MNKTDETQNVYHITFINALSCILKQYQPKNTTNPNIIGQELNEMRSKTNRRGNQTEGKKPEEFEAKHFK